MGTEIQNATELVEREANLRLTKTNNLTIVDDGSNECGIPGYPYRFKASGDKILVSVDIFKSGYECRECMGVGTIDTKCECENHDRPGFKYSQAQIDEFDKSVGFNIAAARAQMVCGNCGGNFISFQLTKICPSCHGKKALLHLADESKSLPTTGVIVSMGPNVDLMLDLKLYDRVLFGAYTGVMIPTKAPGIVFKVLRDIEVLCTIKGGEDLATFDFVTIDKNL